MVLLRNADGRQQGDIHHKGFIREHPCLPDRGAEFLFHFVVAGRQVSHPPALEIAAQKRGLQSHIMAPQMDGILDPEHVCNGCLKHKSFCPVLRLVVFSDPKPSSWTGILWAGAEGYLLPSFYFTLSTLTTLS